MLVKKSRSCHIDQNVKPPSPHPPPQKKHTKKTKKQMLQLPRRWMSTPSDREECNQGFSADYQPFHTTDTLWAIANACLRRKDCTRITKLNGAIIQIRYHETEIAEKCGKLVDCMPSHVKTNLIKTRYEVNKILFHTSHTRFVWVFKICMYAYMWVWVVYVCMYVCMYVCIYVCI